MNRPCPWCVNAMCDLDNPEFGHKNWAGYGANREEHVSYEGYRGYCKFCDIGCEPDEGCQCCREFIYQWKLAVKDQIIFELTDLLAKAIEAHREATVDAESSRLPWNLYGG